METNKNSAEHYAFCPKKERHSLSDVFKKFNCASEVEFVKKFFNARVLNNILSTAGYDKITDPRIEYEFPIVIGNRGNKRADIVIKVIDEYDNPQIYYFEVMSQSQDGYWDDGHHEQFLLKDSKLYRTYGRDNVHSFAIAFGDFDSIYLDDIQNADNNYAIDILFDDDGYHVDAFGIIKKIEKQKEKQRQNIEIQLNNVKKVEEFLASNGYTFERKEKRTNKPHNIDTYLNLPINGFKVGVYVTKTGLMGMFARGNHPNTEIFSTNASEYITFIGQPKTFDFEEFIDMFNQFIENM